MEVTVQELTDIALAESRSKRWRGRPWDLPERIKDDYPDGIPAEGYVLTDELSGKEILSMEKFLITLDTVTPGQAFATVAGSSPRMWLFQGTGDASTSLLFQAPNPNGTPIATMWGFPWRELRSGNDNNTVKGVNVTVSVTVDDYPIGIFDYQMAAPNGIPTNLHRNFQTPQTDKEKLLAAFAEARNQRWHGFRYEGYKSFGDPKALESIVHGAVPMGSLATSDEFYMDPEKAHMNGGGMSAFGGYTLATMADEAEQFFTATFGTKGYFLAMPKFTFDKPSRKGDRYNSNYEILYAKEGIAVISVEHRLKEQTDDREKDCLVSHGVFLIGGEQADEHNQLIRAPLNKLVYPVTAKEEAKHCFGAAQYARLHKEAKLLSERGLLRYLAP